MVECVYFSRFAASIWFLSDVRLTQMEMHPKLPPGTKNGKICESMCRIFATMFSAVLFT